MKKIYTLLFVAFVLICGNNLYGQSTLVINEFDYDQPGNDSAEFIELYNASPNAIDLGSYSILFVNGFNNTAYDSITLPSFLLQPGAFYVICGTNNVVPFCNINLNNQLNNIQNGSPDALAIRENANGNIIDAVSYEGSAASPYVEGTGVQPGVNSDSSLFHFVGLSRFPDGQDSNNNNADFTLVCITPGTANTNATTGCLQPTSVNNIAASNPISVYPNPSKGYSTIDLNNLHSKNATIVVNNVLGKEIKRVTNTSEKIYQLDLTDYPDGVYFVKVKSDFGETTQRIVLRK